MGTCKSATGGLRLTNPHRSLALHFHFVHVTPAPVLARLEGLDDGMPGRVEVFGRVRVLRAVAAADVPAGQAQAQMHPGVAHFQAFLAASATRRYITNRPEMGTGRCHLILLDLRYPVAPLRPCRSSYRAAALGVQTSGCRPRRYCGRSGRNHWDGQEHEENTASLDACDALAQHKRRQQHSGRWVEGGEDGRDIEAATMGSEHEKGIPDRIQY